MSVLRQNSLFKNNFFLLVLILFFVKGVHASDKHCNLSADNSRIIYVNPDATGTNSGGSWKNAFNDLDEAFIFSSSIKGKKQIWLTAGRYKADHKKGYMLSDDLTVIGGFSGKENKVVDRKTRNRAVSKIDGMGRNRIFYIENSANVNLAYLSLENGSARGDINADMDSASNEVRGGAILSFNSNLKFCDMSFIHNKAKVFGGAVYQQGGKLTVERSRFLHNSVLRGEEVVHIGFDKAETDGGAIGIIDADALIVTDTKFVENSAGDDGAGIASRHTNVELYGSLFKKNRAIGLVGEFNNPTFTDDFVTSMGAAISIQNEYIGFNNGDQSRTVIIKDTDFIGNRSAIGGAGFIFSAPGSYTLIEGGRYIDNGGTAQVNPDAPPGEQGVIFGRGASAFLIFGTRSGDRETDEQGDFLRPLHTLEMKRAYFKENKASFSGSLVLHGILANIDNSVFKNNTAWQVGGAIWNQNFFPLAEQFSGFEPDLGATKITSSYFIGNRALGRLDTLQADLVPNLSNKDEQNFGGGAISNNTSGRLKVDQCYFINNSSTNGDGGAIQNATTQIVAYSGLGPDAETTFESVLEVSNSVFIGNKSMGSGGAIANGGSQVNGQINNAFGEDMRDQSVGSTATLVKNYFFGNKTRNHGAAIVNWNSSRLVTDGNIFLNNKGVLSGAIASIGRAQNQANIDLSNDRVIKNSTAANDTAGGIYAIDTVGSLSNVTLFNNKPLDFHDESGEIVIED